VWDKKRFNSKYVSENLSVFNTEILKKSVFKSSRMSLILLYLIHSMSIQTVGFECQGLACMDNFCERIQNTVFKAKISINRTSDNMTNYKV